MNARKQIPTLEPESRFRLTLIQMLLGLAAVGGAGYTVGIVHAEIEAHESEPGHPETVAHLHKIDVTLERVSTLLEIMSRQPQQAPAVVAVPVPTPATPADQ